MRIIVCVIFLAVTKCPTKATFFFFLKKKGRVYFGSWFEGAVHPGEESRRQVCGTDGHMATVVKKRQINEALSSLSSFYSVRAPGPRDDGAACAQAESSLLS